MKYTIALLSLILLFSCQTEENKPMTSLIIGHRGAPHYAPENTLASFEKAIDLGADGIELDLVITRDSQLIVCHDYELTRLCGHDQLTAKLGSESDSVWSVTDYTLDDLTTLQVYYSDGKLDSSEATRLVDYDSVLDFFSHELEENPELILYTEIKADKSGLSSEESKLFLNLIAEAVVRKGLSTAVENLWFQSFDENLMQEMGSDERFSSYQKSQLGFGKEHSVEKFSNSDQLYDRILELTEKKKIQNLHLSKVEIFYLQEVKKWELTSFCKDHDIALDAYTFRDNRYSTDYEKISEENRPDFKTPQEEIDFFSALGYRALMCDNPDK